MCGWETGLREAAGWACLVVAALLLFKAARTSMRPMADIEILNPPKKHYPVTLLGEKYMCRVPKGAVALAMAMRAKNAENSEDPQLVHEMYESVILKMFGKEVAPKIWARLEDDDDDLDFYHLQILQQELVKKATAGDPTTSPSDS